MRQQELEKLKLRTGIFRTWCSITSIWSSMSIWIVWWRAWRLTKHRISPNSTCRNAKSWNSLRVGRVLIPSGERLQIIFIVCSALLFPLFVRQVVDEQNFRLLVHQFVPYKCVGFNRRWKWICISSHVQLSIETHQNGPNRHQTTAKQDSAAFRSLILVQINRFAILDTHIT